MYHDTKDAYSELINRCIEGLPLERPNELTPKKTECKYIWLPEELELYGDAIPTLTLDDIKTSSLKGLSNDPKFREFVKEKLHTYLPYWTFAHDSPMIKLGTVKFKNKDGKEVEIPINKKTNKAALNFAFMRVRNKDNTWVRLFVIDVDKKYRAYYWNVCGFPEPNIETINPVSRHFQYIYLLSIAANPKESPLYQNVMKAMVSELDGADKCAIGYNFRSPCYNHGRRVGKLIKRGKIQCGYNLVVVNHWNEVDLYYDLWMQFRPDELRDEMFEDTVQTIIDCHDETTTDETISTTTTDCAIEDRSEEGRHMNMINKSWPTCNMEFDPQHPSLNQIVGIFKQHSADLEDDHVHYHAKRQLQWCIENIKEKRKQRQSDGKFSDLQRARRAFRTELDQILNGQLQKHAANFFKMSRPTFTRCLKDGRIIHNVSYYELRAVKVGRNWVHVDNLPCSESLEEEVDGTNEMTNQTIIYGNVSLSPPTSKKSEENVEESDRRISSRWSEHGETIPDAAIRYGKDKSTIDRWIASGKLKKEYGKFYRVGVEGVPQPQTSQSCTEPAVSFAVSIEPPTDQDQPLPIFDDPAHMETDQDEFMRFSAESEVRSLEPAPIVRSLPEVWNMSAMDRVTLWDSL
jgi:replicase family protein